jgi:hypothetical protein
MPATNLRDSNKRISENLRIQYRNEQQLAWGMRMVAPSAARLTACAGVLAAGVLTSGITGGIAVADGGDSTSSGSDGTSTASKVDGSSGTTGGESQPDTKPTSTVGSGREETTPEIEPGTPKKSNSSLSIPVLRWPTPEEVQQTGVSAFFGTVDIPVPDVEAFSALRQPDPAPTPTPSFRTQETQEEVPVVDAGGGADGGGGGGHALSAATGEPPVLQAPLVVAPPSGPIPPAVPIPPVAAVAPIGASAGGPVAQPVAAEAAGAKPPLARGTVSQATEPASSDLRLTPLSGQATRVGYPRSFRNPSLRDLAAVALPGVGGLLFMTFGGGFVGYRQANSFRFVRTQGAERFLR